MAIKYNIELGDGQSVVGEYEWPASFELRWAAGAKAADVGLTAGAMLEAMVDDILADVRPLLPAAAPGRKVVTKRNKSGAIQEVAEYPPVIAPETALANIRAHFLAQLGRSAVIAPASGSPGRPSQAQARAPAHGRAGSASRSPSSRMGRAATDCRPGRAYDPALIARLLLPGRSDVPEVGGELPHGPLRRVNKQPDAETPSILRAVVPSAAEPALLGPLAQAFVDEVQRPVAQA